MDSLAQLLSRKRLAMQASFPAEALQVYQEANRRAAAKNSSKTPQSMLEAHGELISKERFSAIFEEAWQAKLEELTGKR